MDDQFRSLALNPAAPDDPTTAEGQRRLSEPLGGAARNIHASAAVTRAGQRLGLSAALVFTVIYGVCSIIA